MRGGANGGGRRCLRAAHSAAQAGKVTIRTGAGWGGEGGSAEGVGSGRRNPLHRPAWSSRKAVGGRAGRRLREVPQRPAWPGAAFGVRLTQPRPLGAITRTEKDDCGRLLSRHAHNIVIRLAEA